MKKLIIIILSLVSILQAQVQYRPEEMNVLNRFAPPLRDTIGAAIKIGEIRTRPQDASPYWWNGNNWYTFPTTSGSSYTFNSPLSESSGAVSISAAGAAASGYVTTGSQTFAGNKTFNGSVSQVNTGTNEGYYQITNTGGNFQFVLTPSSGYSDYGLFTENTGGIYTSGSNGMKFVTETGTFGWGFTGGTTPMFEVAPTYVRIANTWNLPITAGTDSYVLTSNGSGGSTWSPVGAGSGDLDAVLTIGNTSDLSIGLGGYNTSAPKLTAGNIHLISYGDDNHSIGFQSYFNGTNWVRSAAGLPQFLTAGAGELTFYNGSTGSGATTFTPVERLRITATGGLKINNAYTLPTSAPGTNGYVITGNTDGTTSWSASGGGSGTLNDVLTAGNSSALTMALTGYKTTGPNLRVEGLEIQSYDINTLNLGNNVYFNGTDYKYRNTGLASLVSLGDGAWNYHSVASGSAGATASIGTGSLRFGIAPTGELTAPFYAGVGDRTLGVDEDGVLKIITGGGGSNWTVSGSDIYRNSKVGIGANASSPAYLLDIHQNQNAATGLNVTNTTGGTASMAFVQMLSNNYTQQLGVYSSTTTAYGQIASNSAYAYTDGVKYVTAIDNASGRYVVAIGAGVASERLGVSSGGAVTFNNAYTFPTSASPTNGYVLTGNTDGSMSWAANGSGGGMTNPMTTAGDIIVGGSSGTPARLGLGSSLQSIRVNSGGTALEYYTPTVASPTLVRPGDADYTIAAGVTHIRFDQTFTASRDVNFPPASSNNGRVITIYWQNGGGNSLFFESATSDMYGTSNTASGSQTTNLDFSTWTFLSNGTGWFVVGYGK